MKTPKWIFLNLLHIFNDGYLASLLLLLPFIAKDLGLSLTQVGVLGTMANSIGVFLALPAGYLAAKYNGFKILVYAAFMYAFGYFVTGIASTYIILIFTFFLAGIGFGIFHPIALALVSRMSDKTNRGKMMGDFTAIADIGRAAISTLLTVLAVGIGWRMTSLSLAIAAALLAFAALFTHIKTPHIEKPVEKSNKKFSYRGIFKNIPFLLATAACSIDILASLSLFVFLPFLLLQKGITEVSLGAFTATFFIGNMLGKIIMGRVVDRFGSANVLIIAEVLMALFIYILTITSSPIVIVAVSVVLGALTKGTVPVGVTMISETLDHDEHFEKSFGVSSTITNVAAALGPFLFGFVADHFGIVTTFYVSAFCALFAALPAIGTKFVRER